VQRHHCSAPLSGRADAEGLAQTGDSRAARHQVDRDQSPPGEGSAVDRERRPRTYRKFAGSKMLGEAGNRRGQLSYPGAPPCAVKAAHE
jgi:hypothetical protein